MGIAHQPRTETNMIKTTMAVIVGTLLSGAALAQSVGTEIQRNINQQERIEQGLKSGQLNTREAARLEREESRVERMQSRALRDGNLSAAEKNRIDAAQDKVSRDIYREKHDAQTGNPNSASSKRMQADVQRNINQQTRIAQGVKSGELTNREVGRLEHGQARSNRIQANAGADGHVGANEQRRIQHADNGQSRRIARQKHDGQTR
jgi:hypothetical protein